MLILLSILIIISGYSFSQATLVMVKKGDFWGYINLTGEVVVEIKYEKCKPFNSGFAKVGAIFFVNTKGEFFNVRNYIKAGLRGVREFSNGLLAVNISNSWGFINTSGELIIPSVYEYSTDFKNGFALVKKGKEFLIIDKKGNEQKIIRNEKGKITHVKEFSEGMAPIKISKKWGFVNENGEIVIEGKYESVGEFNGGLAWAKQSGLSGKRVGYINKKGEQIVGPIFIRAKNIDIKSGLARIVKLDGKKGYINMDGDVIHFANSREYKNFVGGMCRESEHAGDSKIGYLNSEGEWAIKPIFNIARDFNNGYAPAKSEGKWGVINKKGEWVLKTEYDDIKRVYFVNE